MTAQSEILRPSLLVHILKTSLFASYSFCYIVFLFNNAYNSYCLYYYF
jgi:hypothetical protein